MKSKENEELTNIDFEDGFFYDLSEGYEPEDVTFTNKKISKICAYLIPNKWNEENYDIYLFSFTDNKPLI